MESSTLFTTSTWILPILFAVTLHEAAHGWMALRFGDPTAKMLGRVTFNPLKHIDPVGTVILPGLLLLTHSPVLFGYAKPVPVDFRHLNPPRLGMLLVAVAGPGTNIILALISAFLLHFSPEASFENMGWFGRTLLNSILINCALAIFNMLPILPLDGGRALRAVLKGKIGHKFAETERYGMIVVIALLFVPPLLGMNFVMRVLISINEVLINFILLLAGH